MEDNKNKEIGRINIDVEKKCNLLLKGDTNIYITPDEQETIQLKYGSSSQRFYDEVRKILKKPNFVRVTDDQTNFIYLSIFIKNGNLTPFQVHFTCKDGKYFLEDYGNLTIANVKLFDSFSNFIKIN